MEALRQIAGVWRIILSRITRRQFLIATLLTLLAGLSEGLSLLALAPLLQSLNGAAPIEGPLAWLPGTLRGFGFQPGLEAYLFVVLGLVVARSLLSGRRDLYLTTLRLDLIRDMRADLYSAIAHANWPFLRQKRTADLLSALTGDADRLDSVFHFALDMPARATLIAAHILAAFLIAPLLTLAALCIGSLLAWSVRGRLAESLQLGETLSAGYRSFYNQASEFLSGLKITKTYAAERQHTQAFVQVIDTLRGNLIAYARSHTHARLVQEIAGAFVVAGFLWICIVLARMPVADVLVLALILYKLLPLIQAAQQAAQQLLHAAPAMQYVSTLTRQAIAAQETADGARRAPLPLLRSLSFANVSFRHDAQSEVALNEVGFSLEAGTLTVLCGPSGSGKSTLLDLMAGLLAPEEGKVRIDDCELTGELAPRWRRSVAYVMQDSFLFNDTLRANLTIAKPDATDDDLREALALSGCDGFVRSLPAGLDTLAGERGARFSGGERQRLALARAILRKPSLLILDEPTSALDRENEEQVLRAAASLKGRTTIVLATHRPERVGCADRILALEGGRLVAHPATDAGLFSKQGGARESKRPRQMIERP